VSLARLLVIAGSDSSAGAGLQADLKTAQAFGVYAQTVVTAVTAQNTQGLTAIQVMPPALVRAQIQACLGDIGADAVKIGMLGDGAVAAAVADALEDVDLPLVLDPVLVSTSGTRLLDDAGLSVLKKRLIPRAALVTPNIPETEFLTGIAPLGDDALSAALLAFHRMGADHILFKGGHAAGDVLEDVLADGVTGALLKLAAPRQVTPHTHGTGCTLATAIACGLAEGLTRAEAVARAHRFVQQAIAAAPGLGRGSGPLAHRFQ
jgi:hydroxymethylpyrimidine/phosphomethylpyrimidine kinase